MPVEHNFSFWRVNARFITAYSRLLTRAVADKAYNFYHVSVTISLRNGQEEKAETKTKEG